VCDNNVNVRAIHFSKFIFLFVVNDTGSVNMLIESNVYVNVT
jgi:hypothetical protein